MLSPAGAGRRSSALILLVILVAAAALSISLTAGVVSDMSSAAATSL